MCSDKLLYLCTLLLSHLKRTETMEEVALKMAVKQLPTIDI